MRSNRLCSLVLYSSCRFVQGYGKRGKRALLVTLYTNSKHFAQVGSAALFISHPRAFNKPFPFSKNNPFSTRILPGFFTRSGITFPKFPLRGCRHRITLPAMRENPTPAAGPVSIKHVRNTVPTALQETTALAVSSSLFNTSAAYANKAIPPHIQLEEPSL